MRKKLTKKQKEVRKVCLEAKRKGFAVYDAVTKKRIDYNRLMFVFGDKKKLKIRKRLDLMRGLIKTEEIYKKKFKDESPYDMEMLKKNPEKFVERLIRAVEICTLRWALNKEKGGLNISEPFKIKTEFYWKRGK